MQNLDAGGTAPNNGGNGKGPLGKGYQQHDGQFESTAYRGSDVESQSSHTHIIRKVEWSLTEETAQEKAA